MVRFRVKFVVMIRMILLSALSLIAGCNVKENKREGQNEDSVTVLRQLDGKEECNSGLHNKIYNYLYDRDVPEHLFTLIFKCEGKSLSGKLFGPAPEGEHGLWFFRAELENLKIDSLNNISFEFSQGYLYPHIITMENYLDSMSTDSAGFSRGQIYYKGKIAGDSILFMCEPEYDCYVERMTFRLKN